MSYLGDDVQTLPWSRCRSLCDSQTEPADKTVVTEVPWFLEQELAALDPNNRPTRLTPYAALPVLPSRKVEPKAEPKANPKANPEASPLLLTFTVGSDPADPDNNSAAVIPLRAGSFRVPSANVTTQRGLWARARTRLFGLVCVAWALVARTLVLHRAGA
jgi:hypothetical protein